MTKNEAIDILVEVIAANSEEENEALDMAIEALKNKSRPFGDCSKCIHTYGTLGCCTTVSNEWVYDCEHGMEQYKNTKAEPSEDLISREAAKDIAFRSPFFSDALTEELDALPSADRPKGEWIDADVDFHKCNNCGVHWRKTLTELFDFCPNCGAKMEVEHADL